VFLDGLAASGRMALFTLSAVSHCVRPPIYPRLILRQMVDIGYYSLPVVGLTALFTGMVLALQTFTGFANFAAESAVPTVVVLSVTRELGPVIAGLMVAAASAPRSPPSSAPCGSPTRSTPSPPSLPTHTNIW
jgi:phospholipid/cholesterol/gamma-HCH transport system permease protein